MVETLGDILPFAAQKYADKTGLVCGGRSFSFNELEALSNAFRHAGASTIEAEVAYGDSALKMRVRDDGRGADAKVLRSGRPGHWGLPGMRERARKIRATLEVWSSPGAGTEIELSLKAELVYRDGRRLEQRSWWRPRPPFGGAGRERSRDAVTEYE